MKNKSHIAIYLAILNVISVITGFIYALNNKYEINNYIDTLSTNNNQIIINSMIVIIFFISTLSLISIILGSVVISLYSISIGYIIGQFYINYKIKGIIFSFIIFIINKFIPIMIFSYLFLIGYIYTKKALLNIFGKKDDQFKVIIRPIIKKYIVISIIFTIYNILVYYFGNKILEILTFVL